MKKIPVSQYARRYSRIKDFIKLPNGSARTVNGKLFLTAKGKELITKNWNAHRNNIIAYENKKTDFVKGKKTTIDRLAPTNKISRKHTVTNKGVFLQSPGVLVSKKRVRYTPTKTGAIAKYTDHAGNKRKIIIVKYRGQKTRIRGKKKTHDSLDRFAAFASQQRKKYQRENPNADVTTMLLNDGKRWVNAARIKDAIEGQDGSDNALLGAGRISLSGIQIEILQRPAKKRAQLKRRRATRKPEVRKIRRKK